MNTAPTVNLARLVLDSAARSPEHLAVRAPDASFTYGELDEWANRFAHRLRELGVGPGDRVAIWMDKGARAIAAMQGVLRLGAAYVPIDPLSPSLRAQSIFEDCTVKAVVTQTAKVLAEGLPALRVDDPEEAARLARAPVSPVGDVAHAEDELAFILYTSGSTGRPKGVCISHRNALAFVEWAAGVVGVSALDRLSNHAPFHFDLSVFDLYVAFLGGASCHIVPEGVAYAPSRAVEFMASEGITLWYSVPSALILMMEKGRLLDLGAPPRAVVFAGEPFPIKHLRTLREAWPNVRLLNFYGPTETNVCTWYEVDRIEPGRLHPVPIGRASSGDRVWAEKPDGTVAGPGEEGELFVSGPTVMLGYWGKPPQGDAPYATGDIVRLLDDGNYFYVGRRDHMVKVRGHRIELGDIEATLLAHAAIQGAAVVIAGTGLEARLVACLVARGERPPLLDLKRHCAERLPRYMIVDESQFFDELPVTPNGKTDYQRLAELVQLRREGKP
ncbi:amino acid adenylation domain-containing protein [Pendulispora rubella]|uniref:Amino acid adenylation domain-containing protein n=1 Tax=Pendulispora rubella TaxID=2741070 RepID=A0ABZ2LK79_9BACT